ATFSIPYSIAVALYDGEASVPQYSSERIQDPKLKDLAEKINVHESEKYTMEYPKNWGCALEIKTTDGRTVTKEIWNGKGSADNPLTYDELVLKFKGMGSMSMSNHNLNKIIEIIDRLEEIE